MLWKPNRWWVLASVSWNPLHGISGYQDCMLYITAKVGEVVCGLVNRYDQSDF